MSQLSRPYQVLLLAALVMLAVWLLALRGGGNGSSSAAAEAPAPAAQSPAPQSQPAAPQAAHPARSKHGDSGRRGAHERHDARSGSAAEADRASRALAQHKVVALLVWNGHSADDRAARDALAKADLHHGRVVPVVALQRDISRYAAITRGAQVSQTPTIVVVAPDHHARRIVGFTDTDEIDQVIADILPR